jgi:single-strand DNA-binding protein
MSSVNKVILIGRVGKDPEVRTLENSTKVATLSLATSEKYKDKQSGEQKENTEWHNLVFWKALADIVEKYVKKGHQIYIEGKLRTRSWEKDGVKKYTTEIVVENLTMLGSKDQSQNQNSAPASSVTVYAPQPGEPGFNEEPDDLPF